MQKTQSLVLIRVGITFMWVGVLSLIFLLCWKALGLPTRLALLLVVPLAIIWVPASYTLAIAGNERHQRGEGTALPAKAIAAFGALGLVTGVLTAVVLFLDMFLRENAYVGMVVLALIAIGCCWLAVRLARRALDALWAHEPPVDSQDS